jgi:hypothetical protein
MTLTEMTMRIKNISVLYAVRIVIADRELVEHGRFHIRQVRARWSVVNDVEHLTGDDINAY